MKTPSDISSIVQNSLTRRYSQPIAREVHDEFFAKYKARHLNGVSESMREHGDATPFYMKQSNAYFRMVKLYFPETRQDLEFGMSSENKKVDGYQLKIDFGDEK